MGNGIGEDIKNLFVKKAFQIEVKDEGAYEFPPSKVVVERIKNYATKSGETLEFIDKGQAVTFYLDKVLYGTKIKMKLWGYIIYCKEA